MRVVVTGGTGFVGLAVAEALRADGTDCVLFAATPIPEPFRDAFSDTTVVLGDIRDPHDLERLMADHRPTAVVHLAAVTPDESAEREDPARVLDVNIGGTAALMRALSGMPSPPRLLLASSVAVYGSDDPPPGESLREDQAILRPSALYGISKLAAEHAARRMAALYGIDLRIVRLGPLFGPWEYATGLRPLLSPHGQVLDVWRKGACAVLPRPLFGDWLYSRDAGRGIAALIAAGDLPHTLYNLGGGAITSLADWCARLDGHPVSKSWRIAEAGEEPTIRLSLARDRAGLDIGRIHADTGFEPVFRDDGAIADHLDWLASIARRTSD